MEEQATLSGNFNENDFNLLTAATGWTKIYDS